MIVGVGTDLVEIGRIQKSLDRFPERFVRKVLSSDELIQFEKEKHSISFVAKRFAAKEAVAKALGTGMRGGVHFPLIEVVHDHRGKPGVKLYGKALERADTLGINRWHLSLSDERQHALAFVVAEA